MSPAILFPILLAALVAAGLLLMAVLWSVRVLRGSTAGRKLIAALTFAGSLVGIYLTAKLAIWAFFKF